MNRKVAILQSNFIPWKGYFDMIHDVDVFVLLEDVQYTKNDWRNRNRIKTSNGLLWLTVPVLVENRFGQKISEAEINNKGTKWQRKQWLSLEGSYKKAPFFKNYADEIYATCYENEWRYLSELNIAMIRLICKFLDIKTELVISSDLNISIDESNLGRRTDRVIEICKEVGGDYYLSGPAAKSYVEHDKFKAAEIELQFKDYSNYPEYPQLHGEFEHAVSVLDLLFSTGPDAPDFIWNWRRGAV